MRIVGILFIILGLLCSLSIIGAIFGIPLMLIGLVMVVAGRRRTVITNVVQVSNAAHPAAGAPANTLITGAGASVRAARPRSPDAS